jgi:hypothetical protein
VPNGALMRPNGRYQQGLVRRLTGNHWVIMYSVPVNSETSFTLGLCDFNFRPHIYPTLVPLRPSYLVSPAPWGAKWATFIVHEEATSSTLLHRRLISHHDYSLGQVASRSGPSAKNLYETDPVFTFHFQARTVPLRL